MHIDDFISKLRKPNLAKRAWKIIRSIFYAEQWVLLLGKDLAWENPSWDNFTQLTPPPDMIWADPFIWKQRSNYFIFFEEKPIGKPRGWIKCMTIDKELNVLETNLVMEPPFHISYPFLFEYQGLLYMLPETAENRTVEVYQCVQFPTHWKKLKELMTGIHAVDSTLLEAKGKWWLFTNIANSGGSTWDALHLFYADHPLSENWTPHPCNPVVQDIRFARPAGKIFSGPYGLIRPSQDCSKRYGYAINFNRIDRLSETEYKESPISKIHPAPKNILGTHTWNMADNLFVIDAKIRRSNFHENKPRIGSSF